MKHRILLLAVLSTFALPAIAQEAAPTTTSTSTSTSTSTTTSSTPNPYQDALPGGVNDPNKQANESLGTIDENYGKTKEETAAADRSKQFSAWLSSPAGMGVIAAAIAGCIALFVWNRKRTTVSK